MRKPTIALRKVNEAEYVNARTYWSLHHNGPISGNISTEFSYELRVKYDACDTNTQFIRWDMGDAIRLVLQGEYDEWVKAVMENENVSEQDATDLVDTRAVIMNDYEKDIMSFLMRNWALLFSPAINLKEMPEIWLDGKPIWEHPEFKQAQGKQHKCGCHACVFKDREGS